VEWGSSTLFLVIQDVRSSKERLKTLTERIVKDSQRWEEREEQARWNGPVVWDTEGKKALGCN